jgi:diacylglycerol O-acyltransferase
VRGEEHGDSYGNRITFLPVILPLDVRDPAEMLRAVGSRMQIMKNVRAAELVTTAASLLGAMPAAVQEVFWRGIPMIPLPLPLLNIICTNVPGPQTPLYSVGRRLLALYPQVPTGYELGLGVAALSYDGKLFFGLTADAHIAPDVSRLREYIRVSFQELHKAAVAAKSVPKRAPRSKTRKQPTTTLVEECA